MGFWGMPGAVVVAAFAIAALTALARPAIAQDVVFDIPLDDGRSQRALFSSPANPTATLVMFAGGEGTVEITDSGKIDGYLGNFLLRTQPLWLEQSFAVEVLAAPNNVSLVGERHTEAYAEAVGRAVDFARSKVTAPIWLVGTSAGTIGAANAASRLTGKIAGLVLTSSVTRSSVETVFDVDLAAIAVPVLIVANENDACPGTPPANAPRIAAALERSPRKEVIYVRSDQIRSPVCESFSPHGFLGVEADVAQRIGSWIRATLAEYRVRLRIGSMAEPVQQAASPGDMEMEYVSGHSTSDRYLRGRRQQAALSGCRQSPIERLLCLRS